MPPLRDSISDRPHIHTWLWPLAILCACCAAHGINMFGFPYRESDEGTYMSQAWAVARQGRLAPYTYWYDHAPAGWIQIAAWTSVTGGFHTFGAPVNSGRVLMLVMRLASLLMLYRIAFRLSGSIATAILAALLFSLSAYGTYYGRRVLIDNISIFWMLISLMMLTCGSLTLPRACLSGLALGVSILSKETTVVLTPAFFWLARCRSSSSQRPFVALGWLASVLAIASLYVLMAWLSGELFPSGTWLGGTHEHVSLLGTLKWQASRDPDRGFLDPHSAFWGMCRYWASWERLLVIGGSLAAVVNVLRFRHDGEAGSIGLGTLFLWGFLGRGGVTLVFYLLPLIPLLALNLALAIGAASRTLGACLEPVSSPMRILGRWIPATMVLLGVLGLWGGYSNQSAPFGHNPTALWENREADALSDAVKWTATNIPPHSRLVIDVSMWTDLHERSSENRQFPEAHYYWKAFKDPAIRSGVFHDDWRMIDYIVTTPQLLRDTAMDVDGGLVRAALQNSIPIASFDTGGWPVEVLVVSRSEGVAGDR